MLSDFTACIESGILAAHLAEESQEFDLMGQSLLAVADAYFHRGMPTEAVDTLLRASKHLNRFNRERQVEGKILLNLGVYLRALGRYEDALSYLERARKWWIAVEPAIAERARTNACWIYLVQGQVRHAGRLLPAGDEHALAHPEDDEAAAHHLVDRAKYAVLVDDYPESAAKAWEAIGRSARALDVRSAALLIVAEVALLSRRPDVAASFASLARFAADKAERPDLIEHVDAFLRQLQAHHADAAMKAMADFTGQPLK